MITSILYLLLFVASGFAGHIKHRTGKVRRQWTENPDPTVGGSPDSGWQSMPQVVGGTAYPDWQLDSSGAKLVRFLFCS